MPILAIILVESNGILDSTGLKGDPSGNPGKIGGGIGLTDESDLHEK